MDSCEAMKGIMTGFCSLVLVQRACALTCGGCSSPPPSLPSPSPPSPVSACTGHTFTSKADLKTAATEYDSDADAATAKYGAIAGWCVSGVTDMSTLFRGLINFNADISGWDTSRVTDMSLMFVVRCAPLPCPQPAVAGSPLHTLCAHLARTPPPAPPGQQHAPRTPYSMCPACDPRQNASAFNQPMSWDTSRVTDMNSMFFVRCSLRALPPNLQPRALSPARCVHAPLSHAASRRAARPTPCALLATLGSPRGPSTSS